MHQHPSLMVFSCPQTRWLGNQVSHGTFSLDPEATGESPVMVFVNAGSGGRKGNKIIDQLRDVLHPLQVVSLEGDGSAAREMIEFFRPIALLRNSQALARAQARARAQADGERLVGSKSGVVEEMMAPPPGPIRAVCCGGDGTVRLSSLSSLSSLRTKPFQFPSVDHMTHALRPLPSSQIQVGWVLSLLSEAGLGRIVPLAILPLGTGNDLARVMGWGGGMSDPINRELIEQRLAAVGASEVTDLDKWHCSIKQRIVSRSTPPALPCPALPCLALPCPALPCPASPIPTPRSPPPLPVAMCPRPHQPLPLGTSI